MVAQAMVLAVQEEFVLVMTIGDLVCLTCLAIALKEFVPMTLRGLTHLTKLDLIISMLSAQTEVSVIVTVESVIAFLAMKEKVAKELLAQTTVLVMDAALIFKICLLLQCHRNMQSETSSNKSRKLLTTILGMLPRPEDACVILSMAMLTAPRECASMALM